VFVRLPSTGAVWELEQTYFPREFYWDVLVQNTPADTLHFRDVPEMAVLPCPDGSHLDARQAEAFTRVLVRELAALGVFGEKTKENRVEP